MTTPFGHNGRLGHGFTLIDVAERRVPDFLPGRGVDYHCMQVEDVVINSSVK
jgi:hypothetical protein